MALDGKVVAVTGGFGQLGLAVVQAASEAGARVAALGRSASAAQLKAQGVSLALSNVDVADPAAAARALDEIVAKLGRLDALVNVAGTFRREKLSEGSVETWDMLYRANLRSAVGASHAALPHLLRSGNGRIVNVGAGAAAARASVGMGAYTASKAGVAKLTEALADELKDSGVTVNAVLPSTIDTPANRADMPTADFSRWVAPRDIASVIVFLLSDEARAVTGALIPVSGRV